MGLPEITFSLRSANTATTNHKKICLHKVRRVSRDVMKGEVCACESVHERVSDGDSGNVRCTDAESMASISPGIVSMILGF